MPNYETVFRESYKRALGNDSYNADFISKFYERFFAQSEQVKELFKNTNMSAQKTMLHDSLDLLVEFYTTKKLDPRLVHLARVHGNQGFKVPLELYDLWMNSLIEALAEFDPEFGEDVELAWRLVLAPGITLIKYASRLDGGQKKGAENSP